MAKLTLKPSGIILDVPEGSYLQDHLFDHGVEFPCGGMGTCRGCLVKIEVGNEPASEADRINLEPTELEQGWRLACETIVTHDLTISLPSWDMQILTDSQSSSSTSTDKGLGIAIDVGTTTLAAQLVERSTLELLDTVTAQNHQGRFGADVMSRLDYALKHDRGSSELAKLIQSQLYSIITTLIPEHRESELSAICMVGNSAMHHLFGALAAKSLAHFPFNPETLDALEFQARDLGWRLRGNPQIRFLANLGGFVGSDVLAGILATSMHTSVEPVALLDLGTNGEMVVGNRDGLLCASAAAGPAFEGARIEMGMSAVSGAVTDVRHSDNAFNFKVIGGGEAQGFCGSGLVDAVAVGLDLGVIEENGHLRSGSVWELPNSLRLTQKDIREVQLSKGAISAGFRMLLKEAGIKVSNLKQIYLGGAFGNYIHADQALRIGLLEGSLDQITSVGNCALRGAKRALQSHSQAEIQTIIELSRHVELATLPGFQDSFAEAMFFKDMR